MIRTFEFSVTEATWNGQVDSKIVINDRETGLFWEIDGNKYLLSNQNVRDLKEILEQVEIPI